VSVAAISTKRRRLIVALAGAGALFSSLAGAGNERRPLHLGVVSERVNQPDYMLAQYVPLLNHLRSQLAPQGIAVGDLLIAKDISELTSLLSAGKVDVILESLISTFRVNSRRELVKPLLAGWRKGRRETRSVFITRQNSRITQISNLAGKTLALESPRSTTAYALPRIVLRQHGLDVQPLGTSKGDKNSVRYVLATAEINQAYWVDRGQADAAAFNTEDREALPAGLRKQLQIIHTTEPILSWLLSTRTGLASPLLSSVQAAFLNMHTHSAGALALQGAGHIRQFDRLNPEDLASIAHWRTVAAQAGFGE
jgi:phosphonate transport system substrate-binding protein